MGAVPAVLTRCRRQSADQRHSRWHERRARRQRLTPWWYAVTAHCRRLSAAVGGCRRPCLHRFRTTTWVRHACTRPQPVQAWRIGVGVMSACRGVRSSRRHPARVGAGDGWLRPQRRRPPCGVTPGGHARPRGARGRTRCVLGQACPRPAASAPIVVASPWPVRTIVSGGRVSNCSRIEKTIVG